MRLPPLSSLRNFLPEAPSLEEDRQLYQDLFSDADWNINYVVLIISSCLIASFGLISNSTAVIIGAMLIAPLMLPLRALAFGALEGNLRLFNKALLTIGGGTVIAILLSCLVGLIVKIPEFGSEVLSRTQPNLVDLGIAIAAGAISVFAKIRQGISDALAGTAIAVALMPPLCVVGLSLSQGINSFSKGAFILYLTNLLGITLACMLVFIAAGYTELSQSFGWTLALTALLVLPLGANFVELIRQEQLKASIKEILLTQTVTLSQSEVDLVRTRVNWSTQPPIVYLSVQTDKKITPTQVRFIQEFISQKMQQDLRLVFQVSAFEEVVADKEITIKDAEGVVQQKQDISIPPSLNYPSAPVITQPQR